MGLTYQEVAEILKVIDATECDEVILEIGETRLVVRRHTSTGAHQEDASRTLAATTLVGDTQPAPAPASVATSPSPVGRSAGAPAATPATGLIEVRAPMVGTFYRRPSPQEPVFVEVGQAVAKGQPLCLIEVMKLFTTIEAGEAGVLEAVLAEDGALVEYDQLLFRIRPD